MHACTLVFIGRALAAPCNWRLLGWIDFYVQNLHLHAKSHSHWKGLCVPKHNQSESWAPTPCSAIRPNCWLGVCNTYLGAVMIGNCFRSMLRTRLVLVLKSSARSNDTSLTNVDSWIVTWLFHGEHDEDTAVPLLDSSEQSQMSHYQTVKCLNSACSRIICLLCPLDLSQQ